MNKEHTIRVFTNKKIKRSKYKGPWKRRKKKNSEGTRIKINEKIYIKLFVENTDGAI